MMELCKLQYTLQELWQLSRMKVEVFTYVMPFDSGIAI